MSFSDTITLESLPQLLKDDTNVKLAGIDVDGLLRGKVVSKTKFMSSAKDGFGFCSVIFGWDLHDKTYSQPTEISSPETGFSDIIAKIDLASFRRIPFEDNLPFFLVTFHYPNGKPLEFCPRGVLHSVIEKFETSGMTPMAGIEFEFFNFQETAGSLKEKGYTDLEHLTPGMCGYSLLRPLANRSFFHGITKLARQIDCPIEALHTESGPGVYEIALEYTSVRCLADRACLLKWGVKALALEHGITPCFMAKPVQGLPGNSGHIHLSLLSKDGTNLFSRKTRDEQAKWSDIAWLSDTGRQFLGGILNGIEDIMPLLAPNVNSYKRLVENFWAPVSVSWGLESRIASIRVIAPPLTSPKATRLEIRVPGADVHPYFAMAVLLALGLKGIKEKAEIPLDPAPTVGNRLARDLREATARFRKGVANELFGTEFVDHFARTREHEIREWEQAITSWERERYMELI